MANMGLLSPEKKTEHGNIAQDRYFCHYTARFLLAQSAENKSFAFINCNFRGRFSGCKFWQARVLCKSEGADLNIDHKVDFTIG